MCEFISQSYTYVSWSPLTLSLRNLRRASLNRIEAYADKGNFIRSKRERNVLTNFFLICEFISQTYNLDFRKQFGNTLFLDSGKWYLGAHRGPWLKRKYPHIITGEKLTEKLLSGVWHITQSSILHCLEQFADSFTLCSAKWYLGAHSGLWWKRNSPQIKTGKKPSEKWHFDVWMPLTELHVSLQCSVCKHRFLEICTGILLNPKKIAVTKEISSDEN